MITIELKAKTITVYGHAGMAERGSDIVCASVSTAVLMSINLFEVFKKQDLVDTKVTEDGFASITVCGEDEIVKGIIDNLIFTLKDLELQYPKYIKINENL